MFSLAKNLQLILELGMISKSNVKRVPCDDVFVAIFFKTISIKTVIT